MRTFVFAVIMSSLMVSGAVVFAEEPEMNISPKKHPNLAAAQKLSREAYNKIVAAQKANEGQLGGHAQKAKELLEQVNEELKLAANVADKKK